MFVPMHRPDELSPRAEELARRIQETISAYRSAHPDLSGAELQQAMMRAVMNTPPGTGGGTNAPRAVILAVVVGLVAALGLVMLLVQREQGGGAAWPGIAIVIGMLAILAVVLAIRRSSS